MNVSKYSANGNDFIIFHSDVKKNRDAFAKKICHRQDGIGADGLIIIVPNKQYDFEWQFYNSDGSGANMCGNGSRACAHYAFENNLAPSEMCFLTGAGVIKAKVDGLMVASELTTPKVLNKEIFHNGISWWLIDLGVLHLVSFTDNIEKFDIKQARELRDKYNANVNIASIDNNKNIFVRTYERGVEDETLACGTGMASCFYRAFLENNISSSIKVYPRSKETLYLSIYKNVITFKGEVRKTFETNWNI